MEYLKGPIMTTSTPSSLTLRRMTKHDRLQVAALAVGSDQLQFIEPMQATLQSTALHRDNFVMESAGTAVGFFQIDSRVPAYVNRPMLELCQVVIDRKHQGRGFGKGFILLLPAFLKQQYPDATGVVLTVNCRNKVAYHVYSAGGFHDTGEIYTAGPSGPQHIMTLSWSGSEPDAGGG